MRNITEEEKEEFQNYFSEDRPREPEKRRIYDINRAILEMRRERNQNNEEDDDDLVDENAKERERISNNISNRRLLQIHKDNESAALASERAIQEAQEREWEEEEKQYDKEYEDEKIKI